MRGPWKPRSDASDVEDMLRSARPEPRDEFVRAQAARVRPERSRRRLALALAPAAALTTVFVAALAWLGGLGYVGSGAQQAFDVVGSAVSGQSGSTTSQSPSSDQYKPGKGCGDRNHQHDRRYQCGVRVSDAKVKEGNSGSTPMTFTIALNDTPVGTVTVSYATANGTATAGSDYTPTAGTLTFLAGQSAKTVTVGVVGDRVRERDETILLNVTQVSANAFIQDGQGAGTIINDD